MSLHQIKKRTDGFTIIEVLIVLAIAGLILLVVFLAVPALQRNSRNTAIKSDVQNLLGGIAEFQGNNNGKAPDSATGTGDIVISKGTTKQTTKLRGSTTVTTVAAKPTDADDAGENPKVGDINVLFGKTCAGGNSARAVAVYYQTELSGGTQRQCQDS